MYNESCSVHLPQHAGEFKTDLTGSVALRKAGRPLVNRGWAFLFFVYNGGMKKFLVALALVCASAMALAAQTRTVTISWTASTSTGVIGYNIYAGVNGIAPKPIGCVGTGNGAVNAAGVAIVCVPGSTANTTTFTDTETVGTTVTYYGTSIAAPCPANDTASTPCGESGPSNTAASTIPPQPAFTTTIVVQVK